MFLFKWNLQNIKLTVWDVYRIVAFSNSQCAATIASILSPEFHHFFPTKLSLSTCPHPSRPWQPSISFLAVPISLTECSDRWSQSKVTLPVEFQGSPTLWSYSYMSFLFMGEWYCTIDIYSCICFLMATWPVSSSRLLCMVLMWTFVYKCWSTYCISAEYVLRSGVAWL